MRTFRSFATLLIGLLATLLVASGASAGDDGEIFIESRTGRFGEYVPVSLRAMDITPIGLGAWTIDVEYDPEVIEAVDCVAYQNGVCNLAFRETTIRVTGASARGLTGSFPLAAVVFRCRDIAETAALSLSKQVLTTAGVELPDFPALEDGAITCMEPSTSTPARTATPAPALPTAGTGGGGNGAQLLWPLTLLGAGGVALAARALQLRRQR